MVLAIGSIALRVSAASYMYPHNYFCGHINTAPSHPEFTRIYDYHVVLAMNYYLLLSLFSFTLVTPASSRFYILDTDIVSRPRLLATSYLTTSEELY
jgi:hypothetical protein